MLDQIKPYTNLPFWGVKLPEITISEEEKIKIGCAKDVNNKEFLTQLCRHGFKSKNIPQNKQKEYIDRIKLELETIEYLGFVNYILMVWDIGQFADNQGITRGPCRGSVGGSCVCYMIGITEIDPVENGLYFNRFLSKSRAKEIIHNGEKYLDGSLTPDIDADYCYYRRQEVMDYINKKYPNKTCKLLTTTTFSSKILIKDVLKTYEGASEDEANHASQLIEKTFGIPQEIEDSLSNDPKLENLNFKNWAKDHVESCEIAMGLAGLNRSEGQHASAILIAHDDISNLMPTQLSSEKETTSSFDMYSAQEISLKFDILGLKCLSIIKDVCDKIGIKRQDININDPSIYRYLQDFKFRYGIFQLESRTQGDAAAKVKPKNIEQLAAVLAIARPGAISFIDQFAKYVNLGEYKSIDPLIDDVLKPFGGVCIYQEIILTMVKRLGFSEEEAENLRRSISKKLKEEMQKYKEKIYDVAIKNGHKKEVADLIWKIAEDSAGYQFNKSHSAAYAMLTAYTIWLKVNYPLEFYCALLRMSKNEADDRNIIATIEKEMRVQGYILHPPHLIKSSLDFKIENNGVRFALGSLRGVSDKNLEKLDIFRKTANSDKFSLFESLKNAGINVGIASALIQSGCLDGFGLRAKVVYELQVWNLLSDREKKLCLNIGKDVKYDVFDAILYLKNTKDEKGKVYLKESRFETIKRKKEKYQKIYELNSRNERLCNYWYEKTVLGYSYSESITPIYGTKIDDLLTIEKVNDLDKEDYCKFIGFAKDCYKSKTKAKNDCFTMEITDDTGTIRVKFFNQKIEYCEESNGRLPEDDDLCIIEGKKMDNGLVFANKIGIQNKIIYTKLSELKDAG